MARNSILIFGGQVFGALTTLIYVPLLARYLGGTDYGRYSYTYAFVGLFEMLSVLGLHQIVERESVRDRANAGYYLGHALCMKLLLSLGTFVLIALINFLINDSGVRTVVFICAAETLIRKFFAINRNLGRAFERMEYDSLIVTIDRTIGLVGVLIVIAADLGLVAVFIAFLVASVVQAIAGTALVWRKLARPKLRRIRGISRRLWKESWPIGLALETGQFYRRQGTALLKQWRGVETVGIFSAGYRIYQFTNIIADSVVGALFPVFSRLAKSSHGRLTSSFNSALRYLLLAALFTAIGSWVFAPQIVRVLLGSQFQASVQVLRWLSPAIVFTFMNTLFGFFLRATNKQQLDALNVGAALIVNLGLNVALTPRYGPMGTVWAWLVSEGLASCVSGYLSIRQVASMTWWRSVVIPLLGGLAAIGVLVVLRGVSPFVAVLVAGVAFVSAALGFDSLLPGSRIR